MKATRQILLSVDDMRTFLGLPKDPMEGLTDLVGKEGFGFRVVAASFTGNSLHFWTIAPTDDDTQKRFDERIAERAAIAFTKPESEAHA